MCAAPKQGQKLPAGVDVEKETVLTGTVNDASGAPVAGADDIVRLLGADRIGRTIPIDVLRRSDRRRFWVGLTERKD